MRIVDRDLDRILVLLRNRIRERGFTQLEVQEHLGWGRSYISQLVNRQKSLRVEHVLLILNVLDVKPEDFWAEIYQFGAFGPPRPARHTAPSLLEAPGEPMHADVCRLQLLMKGLISVLTRKGLFTTQDLDEAAERFRSSS